MNDRAALAQATGPAIADYDPVLVKVGAAVNRSNNDISMPLFPAQRACQRYYIGFSLHLVRTNVSLVAREIEGQGVCKCHKASNISASYLVLFINSDRREPRPFGSSSAEIYIDRAPAA